MLTMESEVIALAHSFRELFPIMDIASSLSEAVVMSMVETMMNISIHEDNAVVLVLEETLQSQFTPRINIIQQKRFAFVGYSEAHY